MSAASSELEILLQQLILEHGKLLRQLETQQAAMQKLDAKTLEDVAHQQEQTRLRIAALETRRKSAVAQLAAGLRLSSTPTIAVIAQAMPRDRGRLLGLRDQLKKLLVQISSRAQIAGRLAGAVLGHLNTVVRLLAGSVEQAGLYTKHGVPKVSARIGMMEAVA
jgi:hypothetical protein